MTVQEVKMLGTIEIDETYVGGKNKNRHYNKRIKNSQGRSYKDKTPVLGFFNRETKKVKTYKISDVRNSTLTSHLIQNIHENSIVMTDEWNGYNNIGNHFSGHGIVYHSRGQYVDGICHTNSIEGHWGRFKRTAIGTHHNVISSKHMNLYCNESDFRQNYNDISNVKKLKVIMKNCWGKTLPYKQLISAS